MKFTGNPVADTICRTAEIGLTITGAIGVGTITIIDATPTAVNNTCPRCGYPRKLRDRILHRLVDLPVVGFPSRLDIRIPRLLCTATSYPRGIFQTSLACADDEFEFTHCAARWILQRLTIDRTDVFATTKILGISWNLVNQIALDACRQFVYDDLRHLDGVRTFGVDEHV